MAQADWQKVSEAWDHMLAIDGGLSGTGLALFERDERRILRPTRVEVFTPKKHLPYMEKAQQIVDFISFEFINPGMGARVPFHGVMEFPDYQSGAERSMGWKSGDLQKLTYLIGVLTAAVPWTRVTHVFPRDWKGQLPKDVVERRLRRSLGEDLCRRLDVKTHGWDALGIGEHVLGRFGPEVQNPLPPTSALPASPPSVARPSATTSSGAKFRIPRRR